MNLNLKKYNQISTDNLITHIYLKQNIQMFFPLFQLQILFRFFNEIFGILSTLK